jgi:hypothetical protein
VDRSVQVRQRAVLSFALALLTVPPLAESAAARVVPSQAPWCYTGKQPYPFPYGGANFRGNRRFLNTTPGCRQARRGTIDYSPPFGVTAYGSFRAVNPGVYAPGDSSHHFRLLLRPPGRHHPPGAPRAWPMRDSLGRVFAWISQQRLPGAFASLRARGAGEWFTPGGSSDDRWTVRYAGGRLFGSSNRQGFRLLIQGRACMRTRRMMASNVMVVLFGGGYGEGPHAYGAQPYPGPVYMGIRGFIPERALPARGLADPKGKYAGSSTRAVIDRFFTGCNHKDATGLAAPSPPERKVNRSLSPIFDWEDRYTGQEGVPVLGGLPNVRKEARKRSKGNRFTNYQGWPSPQQEQQSGSRPVPPQAEGRADIVREVKLMLNTTGVAGGGIVRAIVPSNSRFVELDHFTYRDPNVLCSRVGPGRVEANAMAQWMYVRVAHTDIEGWVPFRRRPQLLECPAPAAGLPPPSGWQRGHASLLVHELGRLQGK